MVNHRAAPTPLPPGLCRTRHFWGEAAWEVWGSSRAGGRVGSSSPTHINLGPQGATFPVGSTLNQSENWPRRRSVPTLAWAGGWGGRTVSPGCWHTTGWGSRSCARSHTVGWLEVPREPSVCTGTVRSRGRHRSRGQHSQPAGMIEPPHQENQPPPTASRSHGLQNMTHKDLGYWNHQIQIRKFNIFREIERGSESMINKQLSKLTNQILKMNKIWTLEL